MIPELQREIKPAEFNSLESLSRLARDVEDYITRKQLRKLQDNGVVTDGVDTYEQVQELRKKNRTLTFRPSQQQNRTNQQSQSQSQPQSQSQSQTKPSNPASNVQNQPKVPPSEGKPTQDSKPKQDEGEDSQKFKRKANNFDESKCRKLNCNDTNFNPENEKDWPYYNPKMRCFDCARFGFEKFTCPYHNTLDQAKINRARWEEGQRKKKEEWRKRTNLQDQENREGER